MLLSCHYRVNCYVVTPLRSHCKFQSEGISRQDRLYDLAGPRLPPDIKNAHPCCTFLISHFSLSFPFPFFFFFSETIARLHTSFPSCNVDSLHLDEHLRGHTFGAKQKKCLNLDSDYIGNADKCVLDSGGGWVFLVHLHRVLMCFCSTWFQSDFCPSFAPNPPPLFPASFAAPYLLLSIYPNCLYWHDRAGGWRQPPSR